MSENIFKVLETPFNRSIFKSMCFISQINGDFQSRRNEYEEARYNLTDYGIDPLIFELEVQDAALSLQLAAEEVNAATTRLDTSLERIDENSSLIEATQDELQTYIDALEEALEPPECDFLCWVEKIFDFVIAIGKLVSSIYSFDIGSIFTSLEDALNLMVYADSFLDGVEAIIDYAGMLFGGETGKVSVEVGGTLETEIGTTYSVNAEGKTFKKNVIEEGESIYDSANDMIAAWEEIESVNANPLADLVIRIRTNSQNVSSNLQSNLTDIYQLQAKIEDKPNALAIARSLEDLTKYLQSLNRQIPEFQRQHVIAAADILVAGVKYELAESRLNHAEGLYDRQNILLQRYLDTNELAVVNSEVMMDNTCRYARRITDRALLIEYLLDRSLAYLRLDSASTLTFNSNILIHDDLNDMYVRDVDNDLNLFVLQELHPEQQAEVVVEYLMPVEYDLNISIGAQGTTYQYLDRSSTDLENALCPGGADPCPLSKEAYHQEAIEELKETGALSFELNPMSLEGFQALSQSDQNAWNLGVSQADANHFKKRVLDASARLLFDNWSLPDPTLIHELSVRHGPNAYFYLEDGGVMENFYFSSEPIRTACRSIENITGDDLSCDSIEFFTREVSSPFSEIVTTYQALNTVTVDQFSSSAMYGTSLHGNWTIDISSIVEALETYDQANPNYNGCSLSDPCSALEEFWLKFRGIEFKVFWVPIE